MNAKSADSTWDIEREIVLSRVFDARRELVFKAWTDKDHITKWFGPSGFSCTTHEIDIRVGGCWRFDMCAPDGKVYPNRMVFLEVKYPERLVMDHGSDVDEDPGRFRVIITFDEQSNGKTVMTMRQIHPTPTQRNMKIDFGAVELGNQTMDKLVAHLASLR